MSVVQDAICAMEMAIEELRKLAQPVTPVNEPTLPEMALAGRIDYGTLKRCCPARLPSRRSRSAKGYSFALIRVNGSRGYARKKPRDLCIGDRVFHYGEKWQAMVEIRASTWRGPVLPSEGLAKISADLLRRAAYGPDVKLHHPELAAEYDSLIEEIRQ